MVRIWIVLTTKNRNGPKSRTNLRRPFFWFFFSFNTMFAKTWNRGTCCVCLWHQKPFSVSSKEHSTNSSSLWTSSSSDERRSFWAVFVVQSWVDFSQQIGHPQGHKPQCWCSDKFRKVSLGGQENPWEATNFVLSSSMDTMSFALATHGVEQLMARNCLSPHSLVWPGENHQGAFCRVACAMPTRDSFTDSLQFLSLSTRGSWLFVEGRTQRVVRPWYDLAWMNKLCGCRGRSDKDCVNGYCTNSINNNINNKQVSRLVFLTRASNYSGERIAIASSHSSISVVNNGNLHTHHQETSTDPSSTIHKYDLWIFHGSGSSNSIGSNPHPNMMRKLYQLAVVCLLLLSNPGGRTLVQGQSYEGDSGNYDQDFSQDSLYHDYAMRQQEKDAAGYVYGVSCLFLSGLKLWFLQTACMPATLETFWYLSWFLFCSLISSALFSMFHIFALLPTFHSITIIILQNQSWRWLVQIRDRLRHWLDRR